MSDGDPLLVLNPRASRLADPAHRSRIRAAAAHAIQARTGRHPEIVDGTHDEARAALAGAAGRSLVVAAGGDGTIREAATAVVNSDVPLAVIPGGTANVLAQSLKLGSTKAAFDAIRHGEPRSMDLGLARWSEKGATVERHFSVAAGTGFDARVMEAAEHEWKRRLKFGAYIGAAVREAVRLRPARFRIMADGELLELRGLVVLVANAGEIVPGRIGPRRRIDPEDGLLDLIVVGATDLIGAIRGSAELLFRADELDSSVIRRSVTHVRVESEPPQPVQVDGDTHGRSWLEAEVVPDALHVLVRRDPGTRSASRHRMCCNRPAGGPRR